MYGSSGSAVIYFVQYLHCSCTRTRQSGLTPKFWNGKCEGGGVARLHTYHAGFQVWTWRQGQADRGEFYGPGALSSFC